MTTARTPRAGEQESEQFNSEGLPIKHKIGWLDCKIFSVLKSLNVSCTLVNKDSCMDKLLAVKVCPYTNYFGNFSKPGSFRYLGGGQYK